MDHDIKIGSTVQLLYWRDNKVHDFVVTDIFFERYLFDWKTVVKAKYYSQKSDFWFVETYYINDFFEAMKKAKEYTDNRETENTQITGRQKMSNLEKAKQIIKENFKAGDCGLFNTLNTAGDQMTTIYEEGGLQIDICYHWSYFEVFGLSDSEFEELLAYYQHLKGGRE